MSKPIQQRLDGSNLDTFGIRHLAPIHIFGGVNILSISCKYLSDLAISEHDTRYLVCRQITYMF